MSKVVSSSKFQVSLELETWNLELFSSTNANQKRCSD